MGTMNEIVGKLSANPTPILLLDTCDFLDVIRGISTGNLIQVDSFRRMNDALDGNPKRFQLLITYLVLHEWRQNQAEVEREVENFLNATKVRVQRFIQARYLVDKTRLSVQQDVFDLHLVRDLVGLAKALIDRATIVEKDDSCVADAIERVMVRKRPSQKNQIKDSIHWEHYLKLSGQLNAVGYAQPRIFVSANKVDFWASGDKPTIHPDLEVEAQAVGLQFFGRLDEALRSLGI
jgi:hypothetical protein